MNKKLIALLVANALVAPAAFAQEASPFRVSGNVGIGGIAVDDKNALDVSKLNEYMDMSNGLLTIFDIKGRGSEYWFDLFGENIGRDDQFLEVKGGKYGAFKYSIYNDKVIHNWTYGAITPFTGIGTNNLTFAGASPPSTNTSTWNSFDYGVSHNNTGGFVEANVAPASPFYFPRRWKRAKNRCSAKPNNGCPGFRSTISICSSSIKSAKTSAVPGWTRMSPDEVFTVTPPC